MKKQHWGVWAIVCLAGGVSLGGVAACGSDFGSTDCRTNRTCSDASGGDAAGGNGAGDPAPGGDAGQVAGGAPSAVAGGPHAGAPGEGGGDAEPMAGAAGVGGSADVGCRGPGECSNGDPSDGEETCDAHGVCQPGNPPPKVTAVSPTDKTANAEPAIKVVITFDEPLDAATVTAANVKLLDGDVEVSGTPAYADNKITFTPASPLALLGSYEISVSTAVTDVGGAGLLAPFSSTFAIRDGVWSTIDVVTAPGQFADTLPITTEGNVLLGWLGKNNASCPSYAGWFNRGKAVAAAKALSANDVTDCERVAVGGNAAGVAAVLWQVPDAQHGTYVQQYRAGKWATGDGKISASTVSYTHPTLAVAPNGMVTFFQNGGPGTTAWRTDAAGKWAATGDVLEANEQALNPPEVAFDAQGNGLAIWRATDAGSAEQILVSRYTAGGSWAAATALPGSSSNAGTASSGRGAAVALAMNPNGDAMAVWVRLPGTGTGTLVASSFSRSSGWGGATPLTSTLVVDPINDRPGLVFDGKTFVAAFTGSDASKLAAYSVRYDTVAQGWDAAEKRQAASDLASAARMPRLASDGRGNLMLVWTTGVSPNYKLVYQRYANGAWGETQVVPGGAITNQRFETGLDYNPEPPFPLAMNHLGLGALSWANASSIGAITGVRLASFF